MAALDMQMEQNLVTSLVTHEMPTDKCAAQI